MSALSEPLHAALPVLEALAALGVSHHLGGSIASSVHGTPRTTHDVDIVVDLDHRHVAPLLASLGDAFFADADTLHEAIRRRSSANLIHIGTGLKIDLFVAGSSAFDRQELARHQVENINGDPLIRAPVKSPEDTLLRKLAWFELGRRVSDRQWSDVLGIVDIQGESLDHAYLERWAAELDVRELLDAALARAAKPGRS